MPKERRRTDNLILEKMIENGENLAALNQEMKDLKVSFKGFASLLIGGEGQAGRLPVIEENHGKLESRIGKVERRWAFVAGAMALLMGLSELAYHTSVFWRK